MVFVISIGFEVINDLTIGGVDVIADVDVVHDDDVVDGVDDVAFSGFVKKSSSLSSSSNKPFFVVVEALLL